MAKYGPEAQEKAYELLMIRRLPFLTAIERMREEYPTFSRGTLTKWKNSAELNWEGRYRAYCEEIQRKTDKELVKQFTPVLKTIQEIREKVYEKLVAFLEGSDVITDKNVAHVLSSFVKMGELEHKLTGGGSTGAPVKNVVNILLMVIEKNPKVGPMFKAYRQEIIDAVFEELGE